MFVPKPNQTLTKAMSVQKSVLLFQRQLVNVLEATDSYVVLPIGASDLKKDTECWRWM